MDRISILHIVRPAEGGMKEHLVSLVKNTDPSRFRVMVACPADSSIYHELKEAGIEVFPIDIVGEMNPKRDWRSISQLSSIIRERKPDIVHTHSSKAGLVGRIAARRNKVPHIFFTAHNSIFYENMSRQKKMLFALVEKYLARYTEKIIAVSEALKEEILYWEKIDPEKIVVIQNGINLAKFQQPTDKIKICHELGLNPDLPIVGTVARFAPQKGLTYLIDAIAKIKIDSIQYLIVGDGPLRSELENQVKKLGLQDTIVFAGLRRDIENILPILDVFVLPSVTEGLPLTILEAMAANKPVVATAVGGIPEVIFNEKTGMLVEPRDIEALAQAISKLVENRNLAIKVARGGNELVNRAFSLEVMVNKITDLYTKEFSKTTK